MKTGTTYLQRLMTANRRALADAGFLVPGAAWADHGLATRDVLTPAGDDLSPRPVYAGTWRRLAGEMRAHQGAGSVLSHEFLSFATAAQARRIIDSFPDSEVRVILTVRDAAGVIPAQWQTNCRNGGKLPLAAFVRGIRGALERSPDAGKSARIFERTQSVARMLDVWVPEVGADRVHVVTVPPRGSPPDLLWHRFASVLGVDHAACASRFDYVNCSLGFASSELLRRINRELGRFDRSVYDAVVKGPLARRTLGPRSHLERPIRLHRSGLRTAARWNRWTRSAIETAGVAVVGDLEDLPTGPPDAAAPQHLARPRPQELLEAAADARQGLVRLHAALSREQVPTGSCETSLPVPPAGTTHTAGPAEVRAAVRELTDRIRECFALAESDRRVAEPLGER